MILLFIYFILVNAFDFFVNFNAQAKLKVIYVLLAYISIFLNPKVNISFKKVINNNNIL